MQKLSQVDRYQKPLLRRLAAIAFLDVVDYSRLMGEDEETTLREWSKLRCETIEAQVETWRGRVVDRAGDGIFVEFGSVLDAFRWAVDVQNTTFPRVGERVPIQVRIALHFGDVIDGPNREVQGDGVNIAARLQAYAEPGGVVVSQAVANEVSGKTDVTFSDLGELHLKNIARPVRAFHLRAAKVLLQPRHSDLLASPGADGLMGATNPAFDPSVRNARAGTVRPKSADAASSKKPLVNVSDPMSTKRTRNMARWGLALVAGVVAVMVASLSNPHWHGVPEMRIEAALAAPSTPPPSPRAEAVRLVAQGRAIGCPEHPCPREWLAERALYEQAIVADPDYALPYARAAFTYTNFISSGLSLNETEDRRAAERLATRAAALAPELADAHEARAAVLRQDPDRLEDALGAYMRVLAIEPNQPSPRANAGWMLVLLGRPAEAEPLLKAALALAPNHPRAPAWQTYLGLAELFLHREGHGAERFRRALAQQSPGAAAADAGLQRTLNLASALALDGAIEEARLVVDGVRRQHPALSTHTLWNCKCSHAPNFLTGYGELRRGVMLAGVADAR